MKDSRIVQNRYFIALHPCWFWYKRAANQEGLRRAGEDSIQVYGKVGAFQLWKTTVEVFYVL